MISLLWGLAAIAVLSILSFRQASLSVWTVSYTVFALLLTEYSAMGWFSLSLMWFGLAVLGLLNVKPLRKKYISSRLFKMYKKMMPSMSSTEREALEAGTVSFEGDIFTGKPNFKQLLSQPKATISEREQAFIEGPLNELCAMIDDWDITHERCDMPEQVWQFIKKNKFLGMIIPQSYGGLEFSAAAQVAVLTKLYGRSVTVATTVGVPNSLGPGELLLKYGTKEQKDHYLPRLAQGQEIPCFALTGPNAGSDAASIPDKGIVCERQFNGKKTVGISLTWDKRYITLCPVATLIGLAFKLFDPDNLLGDNKELGITCALIPAETDGVIKGRRHFPLNTAFMNGPTQGTDVFIPMDYVIGGQEMLGKGWRMLMECLSAGRAISLPSSAVGGSQVAALASGAYSAIRCQFNTAIGNFEGIEEALARIAGNTYLCDSGLWVTTGAIDQGAKPAVAGAILKYHTTERSRQIALDAMDIHGGKGICLGPNNYLGRGYQGAPIGITVEGANILTRSLIIFGQGAIRCHPYVFEELEAAKDDNLSRFDKAFFAHAGMVINNAVKSMVLGLTNGVVAGWPTKTMKRHFQLLSRYSANFAFTADFTMAMVGADLKRKEKLSARLGDVLSNIYLASCVLKRFNDDGCPQQDASIVEWVFQQLLFEIDTAMYQIIQNFPSKWGGLILRVITMPLGRRQKAPSDKLGHEVAQLMLKPNATRSRLSRFAYTQANVNCPVGRLEQALHLIYEARELEKKLSDLVRTEKLTGLTRFEKIQQAADRNLLSADEVSQLELAEKARQDVIAVDDFSSSELQRQIMNIHQPVANKKTTAA